MGITDREWSRQDWGADNVSSWPGNVFQQVGYTFAPDNGWVLLRSIVELSVVVFGPSGSGVGTPPGYGTSAYLGVKWSESVVDPGMTRDDESPGVLGIHMLYPTMAGDVGGVGAYTWTLRTPLPVDVKTARKGGATGNPTIFAYLWWDVGALGGGTTFQWRSRLSALWGH